MYGDEETEEFIQLVIKWLKEGKNATLMGKFYDVSTYEGKRAFAEWLANMLWEIGEFERDTDSS